jgi:GTP pyrophosphokinase
MAFCYLKTALIYRKFIMSINVPQPEKQTIAQAMDAAKQHYGDACLRTGELMFAHSQGMSDILQRLSVDDELHVSAYLFGFLDFASCAKERAAAVEAIELQWGSAQALRIANLHALIHLGVQTKNVTGDKSLGSPESSAQIERVRKMLLAMANDIRVVILRLVSRLQTLRYFAAQKLPCPPDLAQETLLLYSPLANRLGIWQVKWELEDLAFRFAQPTVYKEISSWLDEKRTAREAFVAQAIERLNQDLNAQKIKAQISGRPKHIYSIYNKMRGKDLAFADLYDIRAFRIVVADVKSCYEVLGVLHHLWQPIPKEFDDYIARQKSNGYQSLHTVVVGDDGRPIEVQIRTQEMHQFAEYGVAAHWRYKEGGFKNEQTSAQSVYDEQIAWVRQLISWQSDLTRKIAAQDKAFRLNDPNIYVLTPDAKVIELPKDATPIDFAYYVHTNLGHLCRGAKVNGTLVPLNTKLQTGQTVQISAAKQGGPSRDWLRDEFTASARTKSKIRAWFNAQASAEYVAQGRNLFEKELQRLSKTALKHDELAQALGYDKLDDFYIAFAREDLTAHDLEVYFKETVAAPLQAERLDSVNWVNSHANKIKHGKNSVLVVGLDDLMTQLAKCCKPAPPDEIVGFVTRAKGVSIHRVGCDNFLNMQSQHPERVLNCTWASRVGARYQVDIIVTAVESIDMMKDLTEVLAREKILVSGLKTVRSAMVGGQCQLIVGLEVESATVLQKAISSLMQVVGVSQVVRM